MNHHRRDSFNTLQTRRDITYYNTNHYISQSFLHKPLRLDFNKTTFHVHISFPYPLPSASQHTPIGNDIIVPLTFKNKIKFKNRTSDFLFVQSTKYQYLHYCEESLSSFIITFSKAYNIYIIFSENFSFKFSSQVMVLNFSNNRNYTILCLVIQYALQSRNRITFEWIFLRTKSRKCFKNFTNYQRPIIRKIF